MSSSPFRLASFLLVPVALVLTPGTAPAQLGTIISPPQRVNANGAGDSGFDFAPALVSDGANSWMCVFATTEASLTNGGDSDIFWMRSRDLGLTWTGPAPIRPLFLTDVGITSTDIEPALATDGPTRIVAWASTADSPTGHLGIFTALGTSLGTSWVSAGALSLSMSNDAVDDTAPAIAGASGTFVVVWERDEGAGDRDLYVARATASGGFLWSTPIRVDPASVVDTGPDTRPRITTDGTGRWMIVFESTADLFATGGDSEIYACRSVDDGVTWSGPELVNSTASSDGFAHDGEPAVAVDRASGTWLCTWRTAHTFGGTTGGDPEIVNSRSIDSGVTWSTAAIVNNDSATDQATSTGDGEPFVHADQQGHFMVCWTRSMLDDSDQDLRAARSNDLGVTWTNPVLLDVDANADTGQDSRPSLVSDSTGHWLGVWQTSDNVAPSFGTDLDIVAARFLIPREDSQTDFCYGYAEPGSPSPCPCGNASSITSHDGCLNSSGYGSKVTSVGQFRVSDATETIQFHKVPPGAAALIFQGSGQLSYGAGISFGDGRLCVGGALDRLGVAFAGPAGNGLLNFPPTGVSAGETRFYQAWYRDSAAFCTVSTFNLSSAFGTVWLP